MNVQKISRKILPYLVGLVGLLGCDNAESKPLNPYVERVAPPIVSPSEEVCVTYVSRDFPNDSLWRTQIYDTIDGTVFPNGKTEYLIVLTSNITINHIFITAPNSGSIVLNGEYEILSGGEFDKPKTPMKDTIINIE